MKPFLLLCCLLCSCTTDSRYYGMDAARMVGQKHCLAFKNHGELDTAALFEYDNKTFIYHPDKGSAVLPNDNRSVQERFPGCVILPVFAGTNTNIPNGCLPRAIAEVREKGGHVVFLKLQGYNHAYRAP